MNNEPIIDKKTHFPLQEECWPGEEWSLFSDMLKAMEDISPRKFYFITGIEGHIRMSFKFNFAFWGKEHLPRKMKKRIFKTKKLRLKYIPEYYEKSNQTKHCKRNRPRLDHLQ